jgi:hypothetical protein
MPGAVRRTGNRSRAVHPVELECVDHLRQAIPGFDCDMLGQVPRSNPAHDRFCIVRLAAELRVQVAHQENPDQRCNHYTEDHHAEHQPGHAGEKNHKKLREQCLSWRPPAPIFV